MILVTGAAGFIGSNFVLDWMREVGEPVVSLDKLTYAGNLRNLAALERDATPHLRPGRHRRPRGGRRPARRSIGPARSCTSPPRATSTARSTGRPTSSRPTSSGRSRCSKPCARHWSGLASAEKDAFRFLHVSTDEVYGSLGPSDPAFTETTPYAPNSPYSASKAGSDHLVRAYHHTYGLPVLTTNCSNNYGPYQFPEKLIPLMVLNALDGKPLPVYGDGSNVRDWLYVGDHCSAIRLVLARGRTGRDLQHRRRRGTQEPRRREAGVRDPRRAAPARRRPLRRA